MILARGDFLGQVFGSFLTQAQTFENKKEKGFFGGFWVKKLKTQTEGAQRGGIAAPNLYSLHNIFTFLESNNHNPNDPKGLEPLSPRMFPLGSRHQKTMTQQ